jgi:hypothetical protein
MQQCRWEKGGNHDKRQHSERKDKDRVKRRGCRTGKKTMEKKLDNA